MDLLTCMGNLEVIAKTKNFKKASQLLFIEQSTLSKRIHKLEKHYETAFIRKEHNEVYLTREGKEALRVYHKIQKCLNDIDFELDKFKHQSIGTTVEHYINSSLIHNNQIDLVIKNNHDDILKCYNNGDLSCLIIEDLYEDQFQYKSKSPFSISSIYLVSSKKFKVSSLSIAELKDYTILIHAYSSYGQTLLTYLNKLKAENKLHHDTKIMLYKSIQEIYVDLIQDQSKVFIVTSGIIIPNFLNNKLYRIPIERPIGQIKINKYFK